MNLRASHQSMARMLGYALTLDDEASWWEFAAVAYARLSPQERAALAWAALQSLDWGQARLVADAVLEGAGAPPARFDRIMDEAGFWADTASPDELKAYAVVCVNRMPERDQQAFRDYLAKRVAA